jgi:hypothetical protein
MDCDVSLYDTAIAMLTYPATWQLNEGFQPQRMHHSAHPSLVPFQAFPVADGWVVVACPKEKFWQRPTEVMGGPELAADPRFDSFDNRRQNSATLLPILEGEFMSDTVENWLKRLSEGGVPSGPVNSVAAALSDPHTLARSLIVETHHPKFGSVKQVRSPVVVGGLEQDYVRAPARNEHMVPILTETLGYSPEKIAMLIRSGAFGDYCVANEITFTRSRAGHSNDGAHVKQKNWTHVRELVGYLRYDTATELEKLNQIWELDRVFTNYLLPQQKLVFKQRNGAKVTKRYDAATTPHQRAIARDDKAKRPIMGMNAEFTRIKPAALSRNILALTGELETLALAKKPAAVKPAINRAWNA